MEIKKLKKNILVSLAGLTLLSVGLVQNNNVQAATVRTGRNAYLSHNAYIYNAKGKKLSSGSVKSGTSFKVLAVKKIRGKKYVQIDKNEYIKLTNFSKNSNKTSADASTVLVGKNSYVYNAKGQRVGKKMVKHGKVVPILSTVTIKGKKYVQIGRNQFIRFNNVDRDAGADNSTTSVTKTNSGTTTTTSDKKNNNPATPITNGQSAAPVNNGTSSATSETASGNSSASSDATTSDQSDDDSDEDGTLLCLHNSYMYDKNGNRILGAFAIKDRKYEVATNDKGKIVFNIDGKLYYQIPTWDGEEREDIKEFITVSAFEKSGKDQKFNPASVEKLFQFGKWVSGNNIRFLGFPGDSASLIYFYSSEDKCKAYDKAYNIANRVASSKWSSNSDIEIAKENLEKAIRDLDGKPVTINGYSGDKFTLTQDQQNRVLIAAKRYLHEEDIQLSKDTMTIYYAQGDTPSAIETARFIKFVIPKYH